MKDIKQDLANDFKFLKILYYTFKMFGLMPTRAGFESTERKISNTFDKLILSNSNRGTMYNTLLTIRLICVFLPTMRNMYFYEQERFRGYISLTGCLKHWR